MYESEAQSVLWCSHCRKPFDKTSTLKRHGYYCRSRRTGGPPRSRSCISCAKGKTRCDNRRPECSRCLSKAITCQYPTNTAVRSSAESSPYSNDSVTEQQKRISSSAADYPSISNRQETTSDEGVLLDTALNISDTDFAGLEGDYFSAGLDFTDLLTPQTNSEDFQHHSLELSSLSDRSTSQTYQMSIPAIPTYTLRSFDQRPNLKTGTQRITNLILHTLKSYPLMMLHDNNLPPFVHPRLAASGFENNDMEALTNCINLMHMRSSQIHGSHKLFWRNVRMECERLCAEHLLLNKWDLLAAMQALSIYILVRLGEGTTDHNDLDSLLVTTVVVVATQFNTVFGTQSVPYDFNPEGNWTDWILEESARRLCVVYQVVNMLVYFEPAAICDVHEANLILAPLPAKKMLWEAGDELEWKAANERQLVALQTAFGLATNGDLVTVDQGWFHCGNAMALQPAGSTGLCQKKPNPQANGRANWEEWCSGMDGLGSLVMLAASLAG